DSLGSAQRSHLAMQDRIAFLDQGVVALAQHLARVVRDQDAADRAAAFFITLASLVDSHLHVGFVVEFHALYFIRGHSSILIRATTPFGPKTSASPSARFAVASGNARDMLGMWVTS